MNRFSFLVVATIFICTNCSKDPDVLLYEDLTVMNHNLTVTVCGCDYDEPINEFIWHKKLVWDYPVKPGMEEWKEFQSNAEMVNACQIPKNILSSLSSKDLTDICLQYPLLTDPYAFRNLNDGIDKLFSDFNGIRELYKRKEVSRELLNRYYEMMQNISFLWYWFSNQFICKGTYHYQNEPTKH